MNDAAESNTISPDELAQHKMRLERLRKLVNLYAQSRALPLAIPLLLLAVFAMVLVALTELTFATEALWAKALLGVAAIATVGYVLWMQPSLMERLRTRFYGRDGDIVLERRNVPSLAWVVYVVAFVGPAALHMAGRFPFTGALAISLASFALFVFYASLREKEVITGSVFAILLLLAAAGVLMGLLPNFLYQTRYAYFQALLLYICVSGIVTVCVVHAVNRALLRKIKGIRPFGDSEQGEGQPDQSD